MFAMIHPDDLASEIAAHEPYNAFAMADRERHYLWQGGYTPYCGCNACEFAAEIEAQWAEQEEAYDAQTVEELDEDAQWRWDRAETKRAEEFAPDPWAGLPDVPF